ncbi:MAG: VOC family protein [Planctomycetaceae bacterium]
MIQGIDHVGVAVEDLAAAMKIWDALLRETPQLEVVATQKVRTAIYPCRIELLAATAPDSPIARFLAKRGPGIHHVTLKVKGIDAELERLKAAGVPLVNEKAVRGAEGARVAFLHPAAAGGVLVELKEEAHGGS